MSFGSMSKKQNREQLNNFECKRCGRCCTGEGYVNIGPEECRRIAEYLEISLEEFLDKYTVYREGYDRWLIDGEGEEQPCIFLEYDENGLSACRIQGEAKPEQCKTFPMKWRIPGFQNWCAAFKEEK